MRRDDTAILAAYEQWNPDNGQTAADLASNFGISRQRLYQVLARNNVTPKQKRDDEDTVQSVVTFLMKQLAEAYAEIERLSKLV